MARLIINKGEINKGYANTARRLVWADKKDIKVYVKASQEPSYEIPVTLQEALKSVKSDSRNGAKRALCAARKAKVKAEVFEKEQANNIIIVKRIAMEDSENLLENPSPEIEALNKVYILQSYLDNVFDENNAHEYDKKVVSDFKSLTPARQQQEMKRLESIAYKFY